MADRLVFISYSRQQFYYAEAFMLRLRAALGIAERTRSAGRRIHVWFDVARLAPGSDWEQSIAEALTACSALVLIASRAALASAHVRKEWQAALAAGKPVYVVLFEAVRLPEELRHASVIDARTRMPRKAQFLANVLGTGGEQHDALPRPLPFGTPACLPAGVLCAMAVLWLGAALAATGLALTFLQLNGALTSVAAAHPGYGGTVRLTQIALATGAVLLGAFGLWQAFAFTVRLPFRAGEALLWAVVALVTYLVVLGLLQSVYGTLVVNVTNDAARAIPLTIVSLVGCLAIWPLALYLTPSAAWWVRTGYLSTWARRASSRKARYTGHFAGATRTARTFRMHAVARDQRLAAEIKAELVKEAYLKPGNGAAVDYEIAVLTSHTPATSLESLMRGKSGVVCVVASNVRLPRDQQSLMRLQWCDYRRMDTKQLAAFAGWLTTAYSPDAVYWFPDQPESMRRWVVPWRVGLVIGGLRLCAAICVFLVAAAWIQQVGEVARLNWRDVAPAGVGALLLFWSAGRLERYRLSAIEAVLTIVALAGLSIYYFPAVTYYLAISVATSGICILLDVLGIGIWLLLQYGFFNQHWRHVWQWALGSWRRAPLLPVGGARGLLPHLFVRRWTLTTLFALYGAGAAVLLTVPLLGQNAWTFDHTNASVPHVSAGVVYQSQGCQPGDVFVDGGNSGQSFELSCTMDFNNQTAQDISWQVTSSPPGAVVDMSAPPYDHEFGQPMFQGTFTAMSDSRVIMVIYTNNCPVTLNFQATGGGAFQAQIPLAC